MGTYVEFQAKPGCEDQINAAYAAITGKPDDYIVNSATTIAAEIAYIHSPQGKAQKHLRPYLKTVSDWNGIFPIFRCGTGHIKVSGSDGEEEAARVAEIKRDIQFILDNRMLFARITGLDDACAYGYTEFGGDLIEDNKTKRSPPSDEPTFADLPKGSSEFYRRCVENRRPDLWSSYLKFKDNPCDSTWTELRHKIISWKGCMTGLWEIVEKLATERDGQDFGLWGRFRDGNVPPLTLVRAALQ